MNILKHLKSLKLNLERIFCYQREETPQSEVDILKIENKALKSRIEFVEREIEDLVAVSMREVCGNELLQELMHLDSSNGWGAEYKPGVFVQLIEIKKQIKNIFLEHKNFPVNSKPEGNFSYCLTTGKDGKPILFEQYEVSMLNYKIFPHENKSIDELVDICANAMFRTHINKIRVLHNA
jgi:hypothetical protein